MTQNGRKSEKVSQILSGLKENYDVLFNKNTSQASDEDMEANIYGKNIGRTYPQRSCHDLITQKYNPQEYSIVFYYFDWFCFGVFCTHWNNHFCNRIIF